MCIVNQACDGSAIPYIVYHINIYLHCTLQLLPVRIHLHEDNKNLSQLPELHRCMGFLLLWISATGTCVCVN